MRSTVAIAITLGLLGCGEPPPDPIDLAITQYDPLTRTQAPLGEELELVRPPQGGFVVFVGVEAKGLREQTVELRGRLRDGDRVIAEDARTVVMQPKAEDPSAAIPDLGHYLNVANIAVCPHAAPADRFGAAFTVEVQVTESHGRRTGVARKRATLVCRQPDSGERALCLCECEGNYQLGKCSML